MKIKVLAFDAADGATVDFESALGSATATWAGPKPRIGDEYEVEIDVDDDLERGFSIRDAAGEPHGLGFDGASFWLVGDLKADESGGVLRLGTSAVLLDISGDAGASGRVRIQSQSLTLTDTEV